MVDSEKLIKSIYKRTSLWKLDHKHYNNRDLTPKLWEEVATEVGTTSKYLFMIGIYLF